MKNTSKTTSSTIHYSNSIRTGALGAIKLIPKIGSGISFITGVFWPKDELDIWELIKDQVESAIEKAVLEKELEDRKEELNGLKLSMRRYSKAQKNERAILLISMITATDILYYKFKNSSNATQLIFNTETVSKIPNNNTSLDPRRSIQSDNNPASFIDKSNLPR